MNAKVEMSFKNLIYNCRPNQYIPSEGGIYKTVILNSYDSNYISKIENDLEYIIEKRMFFSRRQDFLLFFLSNYPLDNVQNPYMIKNITFFLLETLLDDDYIGSDYLYDFLIKNNIKPDLQPLVQKIAKHTSCDARIMMYLIENCRIRKWLFLEYRFTPKKLLYHYIENPDQAQINCVSLYKTILSNSSINTHMLEKIVDNFFKIHTNSSLPQYDTTSLIEKIVRHPDCSAQILKKMHLYFTNHKIQATLLKNSKLPHKIATTIINEQLKYEELKVHVIYCALHNHKLPMSMINSFYNSYVHNEDNHIKENYDFCKLFALHPHTPSMVLLQIETDHPSLKVYTQTNPNYLSSAQIILQQIKA